ncbi:MAG TPA: methyl-accepting chemotaxis protein [Candidatus Anaerobiospirillum pullistercoris]|uniref:Methyl-accepting chemotaxis protein n=1 Tax=Candidatus Anaerobiospirillum pullistercoris TaxID=2838452 RepID=A0A9D1WDS2_9GAMM|nr:methyl-accepting chemotaxis protein [Candidatus Anaerobiospirillum pullistercoris]
MFDWFLNLSSKIKLFVLSSSLIAMIIIVAAIGYVSNLQSINAAQEIATVINRSSVRVNNMLSTLRDFDNRNVSFLSDATSSSQSTEQYKSEMTSRLTEIASAARIMNPERIGDLQSSPEYRQRILNIKERMDTLEEMFNNELMDQIETSRYAGSLFYFQKVRPLLAETYNDCSFLLDTQHKLVVELGINGSKMTLAYIGCIVALIAVVFGSILSWAICSYITSCIIRLGNFIREMNQGNFDFVISKYHKDDFGQIIDNMREMRDNMNSALTLVKENSAKTENSLHQIVTLAQDIVEKVGDCEGKTINVSAASEEMLSTTQDIAKNCEDASNLSNDTKNIIADGVTKIQQTIEAIRRQSEEIHNNSLAVEKVAKRSLDINSIVNTIEEIAAQTNLLALNAAIEAARAGEAGRGFAVVADEVRALASRTASSTQEIADMVADIQKDAAAASSSINNSVISMEDTSHNTVEVENTMHDIVEHVNSVNMQITQIASAAEEQTAATNEISMHIHGITTLTQDANTQAQNTQNIISETVGNIHELQDSLSFFKLAADIQANTVSAKAKKVNRNF